jgi:hypothetical protein
VDSTLTYILVFGTVLHVIVFAVMFWIRVHRWDAVRTAGPRPAATPCAVCGEPATRRSYDGLDPNEQRDPATGRAYSLDMGHYQPLCAAH